MNNYPIHFTPSPNTQPVKLSASIQLESTTSETVDWNELFEQIFSCFRKHITVHQHTFEITITEEHLVSALVHLLEHFRWNKEVIENCNRIFKKTINDMNIPEEINNKQWDEPCSLRKKAKRHHAQLATKNIKPTTKPNSPQQKKPHFKYFFVYFNDLIELSKFGLSKKNPLPLKKETLFKQIIDAYIHEITTLNRPFRTKITKSILNASLQKLLLLKRIKASLNTQTSQQETLTQEFSEYIEKQHSLNKINCLSLNLNKNIPYNSRQHSNHSSTLTAELSIFEQRVTLPVSMTLPNENLNRPIKILKHLIKQILGSIDLSQPERNIQYKKLRGYCEPILASFLEQTRYVEDRRLIDSTITYLNKQATINKLKSMIPDLRSLKKAKHLPNPHSFYSPYNGREPFHNDQKNPSWVYNVSIPTSLLKPLQQPSPGKPSPCHSFFPDMEMKGENPLPQTIPKAYNGLFSGREASLTSDLRQVVTEINDYRTKMPAWQRELYLLINTRNT